jgi:medium-chain acyl-[acyl-carrier-protein] hydrolase
MQANHPSSRWIQRPRPLPGARVRLFCLPHAGGGASMFRPWQGELPDFVEVCPVQLPGRENRMREQPFSQWRPLVEELAVAAEPFLDVPYAVFGHSTGAMLGFELARALREAGRPQPIHLFASARNAPHLPLERPPTHALPEDELIDDLRRMGGVPDEVLGHGELMALLLPLLRADLSVNETYRYPGGEPIDAPITAFGGTDDPRVAPEALDAWREHARGVFASRLFAGDHFYLHANRPALLAEIGSALETR